MQSTVNTIQYRLTVRLCCTSKITAMGTIKAKIAPSSEVIQQLSCGKYNRITNYLEKLRSNKVVTISSLQCDINLYYNTSNLVYEI